MVNQPDGFSWSEAARLKHVEFIQAAITRQAANSSVVKGWAITVATGAWAFAVREDDWQLALIALVPISAFYVLDAYYLRQERLFRCLYRATILTEPLVPTLSMDVSPFRSDEGVQWSAVLRSSPLVMLYGFIAVAGAIVFVASLP